MRFFKAISSLGLILLSSTQVFSQNDEYVRGQDPQKDAIYDMQMGMAGLKQAQQDPQLLAQLMRDLQDPEMMAEAQKMMNNPEYIKQMKQFEKSKEFKEATKKAKQMLEDPQSAARMMAQIEHMAQRGDDALKKNAANAMNQAMQAMATDADVFAEATKMMKDPQMLAQMQKMMSDPNFKDYMSAMQEMMKDPATKKQFEQLTANLKRAM